MVPVIIKWRPSVVFEIGLAVLWKSIVWQNKYRGKSTKAVFLEDM